MHTRSLRRRLVLALSAIAVAMIVLVLTGAARSSPSPGAGCTHGLSSIGPVSLENGEVTGSTTPLTEACLP